MTEVDHGGARAGMAWPSQPGTFVDTTRCPSCFTAISTSPCPACGLDLTDARTARVLDLSRRIVSLVDERADALLTIHRDAAVAAVPPPRVAPAAGPAAAEHPTPVADDAPGSAEGAVLVGVPLDTPAAFPPPVASAIAPVVAPRGEAGPEGGPTAGGPARSAPAAAAPAPVVSAPAAPPRMPPSAPAMPASTAPASTVPAPPALGIRPPTTGGPGGTDSTPADPRAPRRSSVQVFLLSAGVVLLAVAAAFFLTVAWISGGLVQRAVVIGLVTAAVIAAASVLRWRKLDATAEGIALLGIALFGLDVWAVRATDVAGAASADPAVFWGTGAIAAGVAFVGWSRLSRLRAPLSAAVIVLALGPAILASGLVGPDSSLGAYAAGLVAVVVALAAPYAPVLARPRTVALRAEIVAVRVVAALGALLALTATFFVDPGSTWSPVLLTGVLALALAAHAWSMTRRGESRPASTVAIAAVLVVGTGVGIAAVRAADPTLSATVPVLVTAVLALVLDVASRRALVGAPRTTLTGAAIAAGAMTGLAALVPVGAALSAVLPLVAAALAVFGRSAFDVARPDADATAAVVTLAVVVALAAVASRLSGVWAQRRLALASAAAAVALLAGPQLRVQLLVVAWYLAIAITAIAVLRLRRGVLLTDRPADAPSPPAVAGSVVVAAVVGAVALVVAGTLSFASPLSWSLAALATIGVLGAAAGIHRSLRVASTVAVVLFASTGALLVPAALRAGLDVALDGGSPPALAMAVSALCALVFVVPLPQRLGLDAAQRSAGVLTALPLVALSGLGALVVASAAATDAWLAVALLTAAAVAAVVVGAPSFRTWRSARPVAAFAAPVFAAGGIDAVMRLADADASTRVVVAAALAVLLAALALRTLGGETAVRWIADVGTAAVVTLAVAATPSEGLRWVPLVLAAVTALLWATATDGLFTSRGGRRHLVWLALLLGTLALWTRLSWQGAESLELFTVPVGVAVLLLAAGTERARRRLPDRSVAASAVIAAAGVAVALVPSALSAPGHLPRGLIVVVVAVAVTVAGAWVRPPRTPDALPVALGASGALALVLLVAAQLTRAIDLGLTGLGTTDAVVVVTAAALGAASVGIARRDVSWARPVARGTAVAAVAVVVAAETALVLAHGGPVARAVISISVLGAVGILALRRASSGSAVAWTALGGAALIALAATAAGVRPVEWMTIPLAIVGILTLARAGSEPPPRVIVILSSAGLAVGMLPSAVLAGDSLPRAIAVVVVALLVLLAAVRWLRGAFESLLVPTVTIAAGALVVAASLRALRERDSPAFDLWVLAAALVLVGVALLLKRRSAAAPAGMPPALTIAALGVVTVLSAVRVASPDVETVRVVVTLIVLLGIGVWWREPLSRAVFWVAVGLSLALAVLSIATGAVDPVEAATVPPAAALLVHGIRELRRRPDLGSWPALGIGLALLLAPSLLFDFSDDNTLWRAIGLGIVALAALLLGVRFRLQAPVLLGGAVLIAHAVAQLWPWIASIYESASGLGWLWLGVAGALLIFVAATYERRIREAKAVALAIRALR